MTIESIHEWLSYSKKTGNLTWKKSPANKIPSGSKAGSLNQTGYVNVYIKGKCFKGHRLAFYMVNGRWPKLIDHINGKKSDNRWINLREIETHKMNQQNRKCHRKGVLWGTFFHKFSKRYYSRINYNGNIITLGTYPTREEAHSVSILYAKKNRIPLLKELK